MPITQWFYSLIMSSAVFNPEMKVYCLPAKWFEGYEPDSFFYFDSKLSMHQFIINEKLKVEASSQSIDVLLKNLDENSNHFEALSYNFEFVSKG